MRSLAPRVDSLLNSLVLAFPLVCFATAATGRITWWDALIWSTNVVLAIEGVRRWRVLTIVLGVAIALATVFVLFSTLAPGAEGLSSLSWLALVILLGAVVTGEAWHRTVQAREGSVSEP